MDHDRVPVLRVSYEKLVQRVRDKDKSLIENEDVKKTSHDRVSKLEYPQDRKPSEKLHRGAAALIKHSLGANSPTADTTERVWQEAWSKWTTLKDSLDRTLKSANYLNVSTFQKPVDICTQIENIGLQLYTEQVDIAFKHDIVTKIWRTAHYPITDIMRKTYKKCTDADHKSDVAGIMKAFFEHAMSYYGDLVSILQSKCSFDLSNPTSMVMDSSSHSKSHYRKVKQSINISHLCFIYMGDVSRYSEEISSPSNWSKPRQYYLKSVHLVPKNGHPYNQLAVIAINSHRRLDAVYYYIRSLCSKNVFLSANDALVGLFDETAKKAQADEATKVKKQIATAKNRTKKKQKSKHQPSTESLQGTQYVWVMPTENTIKSDSQPSNEEAPSVIDPNELSRKLNNSFLIVHGKLFSRIGIETIANSVSQALDLLKTHLLVTTPLNVVKEGEKLIMMVAINLSCVHQKLTEFKENGCSNPFYVMLSISYGMQFTSQLIGHLLDHLPPTTDQSNVSKDSIGQNDRSPTDHLVVLLPTIRVWLMWLITHISDWTQLKDQSLMATSLYNFLCGLISLLNHLKELIKPYNKDTVEESIPSAGKFWEDRMLAGFTPLSLDGDYLTYPDISSLSDEQHYQQCIHRINSILDLGMQLALNEEVPIVVGRDTGSFEVTMNMTDHPPSLKLLGNEDNNNRNEDSDGSTDNVSCDDDDGDLDDVSSELRMLKLEKDRLSKQMKSQLQTEQVSKSVLNDIKTVKVSTVTIKPKYLVPDTNCFINSLECVKSLLKSGHFVISVPLTVITELNGLSKGSHDTAERDISIPAQLAVAFINTETGSAHFKALTSQGNLLSSLTITTQLTDKATNDDLILTSCIKLHQRVDVSTSHEPVHADTQFSSDVSHSVVLLTDDRNLKVKSHANHMPVKSIQELIGLLHQISS